MHANKLFDLSDRVALVTGGSRGLGLAMARGFAEAGAKVVVTSRKAEACDAAAAEIANATGRETLSAPCHVGDWDALPTLVDRVYERFGRLDVLVNNAGINPATLPITEITSEYFDKLYSVNVKGPMRLAALAAPRMGEAGGGVIINVITVGAYSGGPGQATYTSAKAALLTLTKVMAAEWAPLHVRVNALAPGPFMTDMLRGAASVPGFVEGARNATLQQRIAEPEEIVGSALYLASDASAFVTGEDLVVAGGYRK
jgi:NAD(P)-dependent dehydrogenase (short-subunit alcohol dehydrogenase family)